MIPPLIESNLYYEYLYYLGWDSKTLIVNQMLCTNQKFQINDLCFLPLYDKKSVPIYTRFNFLN